jgi:cob(I)alamin adenosyltransferase
MVEAAIADVETEIPPIRSFTVPGATPLSAHLDVARTIARRAERALVTTEDKDLRAQISPYLNRLSSLLFAYARLAAHHSQRPPPEAVA